MMVLSLLAQTTLAIGTFDALLVVGVLVADVRARWQARRRRAARIRRRRLVPPVSAPSPSAPSTPSTPSAAPAALAGDTMLPPVPAIFGIPPCNQSEESRWHDGPARPVLALSDLDAWRQLGANV
jgi:hypothetical protein